MLRAVGLILAWCSTSAGLSLPEGLWSPRPAAALLGRSAVSPLPPAAPHHRDNGALNTKDGHEEMLRRSADLLSMDVIRAAEAHVEERGRLIDESHRLWLQGEKRAAELIDVQVAELREKVWTMVAWSKAILPLDMQQDEDDGLPVGTRYALENARFAGSPLRPAAPALENARFAGSPLRPAAPLAHIRDNGALNTKDGHEEMLRRSADLLSMDVIRAAEAHVEERGRLIDESHRLWHQGEKRAAELIDVQVAELREKVFTMVAWSKAILPLDMQQDEDDGLPVGTRYALERAYSAPAPADA